MAQGWGFQKPVLGTCINWSHPLAQNLEFCALLNEQGGTVALESRINKSGTFTNTPTWSHRVGGGVDFSGTAYIAWAGLSDTPYTGPLTLVWRGVIDTGSAYRHFFGKHTTDGQNNCPFDFRTNNAATPVMSLVRSGAAPASNYREFTGPNTVLGEHRQYAVTTTAGEINTTPTFYVDSTPTTGTVGSVGGGGGTGAVSGSGADINMGRRADGAVQMDGICTMGLIYSRALGAGEIARLVTDPYALFAPPAMQRWWMRAAG